MQAQPICSACVMCAVVLEASEQCFRESMRAKRAWIHESNARSLPRLLHTSHMLSRLAQPAAACAIIKMQEGTVRMRAGVLIALGALQERGADDVLNSLRTTHISAQRKRARLGCLRQPFPSEGLPYLTLPYL